MSVTATPNDVDAAELVEITRHSYRPTRPFDAATTLHKPSHFPSPFERTKPGEYLFMTRVGTQVIGGHARFPDSGNQVELVLFAPSTNISEPVDMITGEIARRLGLTMPIRGYDKLWDADPILSTLPAPMRGARPSSPFSLYEFLVICTLLQNTTVGRTVSMARALADRLGVRYRFATGDILSSFWTPAQLTALGEAALRELRMGYRAKMLVRTAEHFHTQPDLETDLLHMTSEPQQLRKQLNAIYGVGPASVGYIMFEWFKTVDSFEHVSPWELKILSKLLFDTMDTAADQLLSFTRDRWSPYTMLAVHAVFEAIFWRRAQGQGPEWLDELIRL